MAESAPQAASGAPSDELEQLEQLADEIWEAAGEAEGELPASGGGAAAAAAASAPGGQQQHGAAGPRQDQGGVLVSQCWETAIDLNSGHPYWFNRATGERSWHPPPGWAPPDWVPAAMAAAGAGQPPAASEGEAGRGEQQQQQWEPGLYYRDTAGQLQGPFSLEEMRGWRGMLPMDLPVLQFVAEADTSPAQGNAFGAEQPARQPGSPGAGQRPGGSAWKQLELAGLLGDSELLERWRLENPEQAAWPGSAPPAAWYEAERQRGSAHSLAQAVLWGLPAHDEAVAVARVAAASGKSIQEVADWGRSVDYTATAYRVAARGRVQVGGQEHLYAEASSWANPHELEQQLARAAERRKRPLKGEELRQVIERKKALKREKATGWLYT